MVIAAGHLLTVVCRVIAYAEFVVLELLFLERLTAGKSLFTSYTKSS